MIEERYEIIKLLGKGRTGGIYEAEDTNLGRKVAMRRFFSQNRQSNLTDYKDEFEQVAHSLSALQHPNLLRVYDAGFDQSGAYIISQLLQGETLHNRLKAGALPIWEVNDIAQQMLDALSTAHKEGFVHGAITPGSILMSPRARGGYLYVILDMGLSRLAPLIQGEDSVLSTMADPAILAPELFGDSEATERGDLYMLGHILYMCLAGGHPFGGLSAEEAERMHQEGLPPLTDYNQTVPEDFCLWIESLSQLNPEDRPESAVEALNSLPKVQRPARESAGNSPATTLNLNTGPRTNLQSPAGPMTGPLSTYGVSPTANPTPAAPSIVNTGPLTAATAIYPAGSTITDTPVVGGLPVVPKKSSKLGLLAGVGALLVGVAIAGAIFLRGENIDAAAKKTSVDAKTNASGNVENSYANRHADDTPEDILFTHYEAVKADKSDWKIEEQDLVKKGTDGTLIQTNLNKRLPGIKFPMKGNENDMLDFGWRLTYVVRPVKGEHRLGFHFDDKLNPGWDGDIISLYLTVGLTAEGKVKLAAMNSGNTEKKGKSITVPYQGRDGWHTIIIEQEPVAESGAYSVTIDGRKGFQDTFTTGKSFNPLWNNHLFSSAFSTVTEGEWLIKEIKLETP